MFETKCLNLQQGGTERSEHRQNRVWVSVESWSTVRLRLVLSFPTFSQEDHADHSEYWCSVATTVAKFGLSLLEY